LKPVTFSALYFDLGNVLLNFDWVHFLSCVEQQTSLKGEELRLQFKSFPDHDAYEAGSVTCADYFTGLKSHLHYRGPESELQQAWSRIFTPNLPNISLIKNLFGKYPLFLISNTNASHIEFCSRAYTFFSLFSQCFYSHELKMRKPDPAIYLKCAELSGQNPAECLFIDDLPQNVEGAIKAGFHALVYRQESNLQEEFHARGITL